MSSSADFIELTSSDLPAHSPVTELAGELLPEDPLSHPAVVAALAAGAVTLPPKSRSAVTRGRPATEPQAGHRSRAASRRSSPGPPAAAPTSSEAAPSIQELTRVLAAALAKAAPTPPPSILDTVVPPPNFSGKDTTPTEFNEFAFQLTRALRQRHLLPPTFDLPSPLAPPPVGSPLAFLSQGIIDAITACFSGNALAWLRLEANKGSLPTDFVRFLLALQGRFILSLASATASAKTSLESLSMGKQETIRQLHGRIDSLLLAAGGDAPADKDLLRYFKAALRPELRVGVWTAGTPESFAAAIRKAEEIESLYTLAAGTSRTNPGSHGRPGANRNPLSKKALSAFLSDAGVPEGERLQYLALHSTTRQSRPSAAPNPASPSRPHPPKMTPEIREKCRVENLCFRCREPIASVGHVGAECPHYPSDQSRPTNPANAHVPAPAPPSAPAAAVPTPRARAAAIGRRVLTAAEASSANPSTGPHPGPSDTPGEEEGDEGADAEDDALYAFAQAYRASRSKN